MGALPKKKRTQSRKRSRWSHLRLSPPTLTSCPQCRELKPTHRVCPHCGYYAGREIIATSTTNAPTEE